MDGFYKNGVNIYITIYWSPHFILVKLNQNIVKFDQKNNTE